MSDKMQDKKIQDAEASKANELKEEELKKVSGGCRIGLTPTTKAGHDIPIG